MSKKTLEINRLRKETGLRYRVTATELPGGEYAATIQIRCEKGKENPPLVAALAYDLWMVSHQLAEKAGAAG